MILSRHIAAPQSTAPNSARRACRTTTTSSAHATRIRILGRSTDIRPPPKQLLPVLRANNCVSCTLERIKLTSVLGQLGAEALHALLRLLLLGRVDLLPRERRILVERALEGRQAGLEGAERRGRERRAGWGGLRTVGMALLLGRQRGEVFAERSALL
jgi:hypothetical protein